MDYNGSLRRKRQNGILLKEGKGDERAGLISGCSIGAASFRGRKAPWIELHVMSRFSVLH